jgi:hypothetical protein
MAVTSEIQEIVCHSHGLRADRRSMPGKEQHDRHCSQRRKDHCRGNAPEQTRRRCGNGARRPLRRHGRIENANARVFTRRTAKATGGLRFRLGLVFCKIVRHKYECYSDACQASRTAGIRLRRSPRQELRAVRRHARAETSKCEWPAPRARPAPIQFLA